MAPCPVSGSRRGFRATAWWLPLLAVASMAGTVGFAMFENPLDNVAVIGDGEQGPLGMAYIPGGEFTMGSDQQWSSPNERPAHRVHVDPFWMDRHHVTNAEFRRFVETTGYITTAERKPVLPMRKTDVANLAAGALVFIGTDQPVPVDDWSRWWAFVPGANWRHPQGPRSSIEGRDEHPVVQVSYEDAQAYARWAGKRLPTEAEWEFAARGGLEQAQFVWGDEFAPGGRRMANTLIGPFPVVTSKTIGMAGTTPVGRYPANGYGLYDMAGNAWQWVADWYRSDAFSLTTRNAVAVNPHGPANSFEGNSRNPARVTRGGSFLCSERYCSSYRPSARRGNDPSSPMSHIGFRLVMTEHDWQLAQQRSKTAAKARELATLSSLR